MTDLPRPGRCVVIGVLNVTPDSFSDGGRFADRAAAVAHGVSMWRDGADLVDVGGESTRPGAGRVDPAEESRRVLPVIADLTEAGVPVSIDTTRSAVAVAALEAGAVLVNDVSGGLADPEMAGVVASAQVPWILMHWRGPSEVMGSLASYDDVVRDVCDELSQRVDAALAAGVDPARIVVDPGLGFAKTAQHNWSLLAGFDAVVGLGYPVLVGASRKRFLGELPTDRPAGGPRPPAERDPPTAAVSAIVARAGAWGVRVHEVGPSVDAARVAAAVRTAPISPMTLTTATDRITLTGLRVHGRHGVFDHERRDGQEFLVDATLHTDTRVAAASDTLADTADYGGLAQRLADIVAAEPCRLIETLAARLADACLADARLSSVDVTVHKPAAPIAIAVEDVSVSITRSR